MVCLIHKIKQGAKAKMKRKQFYEYLSEKYHLPYKYIAFKMNPYYFYKASVKVSLEYLEKLENAMNWEYMKEDFERDRNTYASIFYGMQAV